MLSSFHTAYFNSAVDSVEIHGKIDSKVNGIGTRKLKVFKNKIVLKQTGGNVWIASALVGNTPKVNVQHYTADTKDIEDNQLSIFAESMIRTVREYIKDDNVKSSLELNCSNYNNPESFIKNKSLDCSNIFSCFFCKHYGVNPDKEDIHKLMSLLYIIRRIETGRSFDQKQFDEILKPIDKLINIIFEIMAKKHNAGIIINEVQTMVFTKTMLHKYWEFKLKYLYDIGAF